jgi:SAM-dependent methyltransferase
MAYAPDELFASTAPYYARYRPAYHPAFYDLLAERFGLDGTETVLDLGTGTGVIALGLAPLVGRVIAVDPEPGMLAEGRRIAAERGICTIDWRLGDSTLLPDIGLPGGFPGGSPGVGRPDVGRPDVGRPDVGRPDVGRPDVGRPDVGRPGLSLAVLGQSFHWTDREQVLRGLDALISPGGSVVLVTCGGADDLPPAPWLGAVAEVRTRYLGPERRAGSGTYAHPEEGHQDVLARSAFAVVDTVRWAGRHLVRTLDQVVGWVFSLSYSSPAQLGDRKDAFERDLRDALVAVQPDGRFEETISTEAIIATRP